MQRNTSTTNTTNDRSQASLPLNKWNLRSSADTDVGTISNASVKNFKGRLSNDGKQNRILF